MGMGGECVSGELEEGRECELEFVFKMRRLIHASIFPQLIT